MADEEDGNHLSRCIIHCTDDQSPLTKLRDGQSWETLLKAAKVRGHAAILQLADETPDGSFPSITYHRSCRQMFTMKSSLEAIIKSSKREQTDDAFASQRTSLRKKCATSSSSAILPTVCIFCGKDTKFMKKSKTNKLGVSNREYKRSLLGVYCFTGCDTVSAFAGKGKLRALKLLQEEREFVAAFSRLGSSWVVDDNLINDLQKFVCRLYGQKQSTVNE